MASRNKAVKLHAEARAELQESVAFYRERAGEGWPDWLKAQANSRYAENPERWVNYEDLAYLAAQIHDDLAHEYENPALQPFVRNALIELAGLFSDAGLSAATEPLLELAGATVHFVRSTVARLLSIAPSDTTYLHLFAEACRDSAVSEVNLFTLNHDTLIEKFLWNDGIKVVDGLRDASNADGSRRWDSSVFDDPSHERGVKLFKLHGSVDWFRCGPRHGVSQERLSTENTDRDGRFVGTYSATTSPLYERLLLNEGPQLLAGTFNKIPDYNSEIFLDLHHRFHRALQDCRSLVVCGYGFGDKGVNTRIAEWRHRSSGHKLLIIDPAEPANIARKARGAVQREIAALDPHNAIGPIPRGLVIHLQNGLQDQLEGTGDRIVTWERVRSALQDC